MQYLAAVFYILVAATIGAIITWVLFDIVELIAYHTKKWRRLE